MTIKPFSRLLGYLQQLFLQRISPAEIWMLLATLLAGGGIWIFIELAEEVLQGETREIDTMILLALRTPADVSDPRGPLWFEETMRDVTALGGFVLLTALSLAVVGFLLLQKRKKMAFFLAGAVFGGYVLSSLLKHVFERPRPDLVPHQAHVMTASFPSGHSMLSAVVFLTLGGLLARYTSQKRLKLYILSLSMLTTFMVGCSRVYLGVHWPTDVLAGWTAGASWALLCWLCALLLQRRGRIEKQIENKPE